MNLLDFNLDNIKPVLASTNLNDYSMMITAPSGFGKTPFLFELFGDKALFLTFENSNKGLAGIQATPPIPNYTALEYIVNQLEFKPELREKYDVIVIDTLFLFDYYCEQSVTESYGKDLVSDCLQWNKAYKIVDKKFLNILKRLQSSNYNLVYVCHPVEKKVKMPDGTEVVKFEPKVSDRIKDLLIPEVDIRLFCHYDQEGNKVIYTQNTPYFDARCRAAEMPPVIPFDAQKLRETFKEGIEKKVGNKEYLVDSLAQRNVVSGKARDFKEVMDELIKLGTELGELGLGNQANEILNSQLGLDNDGKQRTLADATEKMTPALETTIVKLNALKEQHSK